MNPLSSAYLCVRDLDADGCPIVGGEWSCAVWGNTGFYELRRSTDGAHLLAWKANAVSARGLFALFGRSELLEAIAATEPACMPAREAWARRGESAIRAWLRRWRHWRIDGHVRDADGVAQPVTAATVELVPYGAQIPDPTVTALPWLLRADGTVTTIQAEAAVRVTAIHRPALAITVAGFSLHTTLEDEPQR